MRKLMKKILLYFLLPFFGLALLGAIIGEDDEETQELSDQQAQVAVGSKAQVEQNSNSQSKPESTTVVSATTEVDQPPVEQRLTRGSANEQRRTEVDRMEDNSQKPTSQPEPEHTTVVVAAKEVENSPAVQALPPLTCQVHPSFTLSYDGPVQLRRIAKDTVEKMGMNAGPLDALPANKTRSWYFSSSGPAALTVLSMREDWTWFMDGDTVKFRKRDDTKGLVIYEVLEAKPSLDEGKLSLNLETDLPDEAEVTVEVYRSYEAKGANGRTETYSHGYFRECGTIARWKANVSIAIDEDGWARSLKEHQNKMGRLGKHMAFDIVSISDHVTVSASGGISNAIGVSLERLTDEDRVLKPREVLTRQNLHVSWDSLEVGNAYRFLKNGILLVPRRGIDGELIGTAVRLTDKEVVVVEAVEDSVHNSFWYLVSVDGRWGWVNGDALIGNGAVRVPSQGDQDPVQLKYRQEIAEHVLKPCLSRAYEKAARSNAVQASNFMKSEMMRAMIDASHDMVAEFIKEAIDLGLGLLPLAERMDFYRKSRDRCIAGA